MKKILGYIWCVILTILAACATEIIDKAESFQYPEDPADISLRVRASYSDDDIEESQISNLTLYFFDGTPENCSYLGASTAIKNSSGALYRAALPYGFSGTPSFVIAIANLDKELTPSSLSGLLSMMTENAVTDNGIVMTSARGFSSEGSDIFYSEIKEENLSGEDAVPVDIFLERITAKGSVSVALEGDIFFNCIYKDAETPVKTELTGWAINKTDRQTFIIKNLGNLSFEELSQELNNISGWNESIYFDNRVVDVARWAHSQNWQLNDFSFANNDAHINFLKYSEIDNKFSPDADNPFSVYFNETTRHGSSFLFEDALPELTVAATHTIGENSSPVTFYKNGDDVMLEDDFREFVQRKQTAIKYSDNSKGKVTLEDLWKIIEERPYPSDGLDLWNMVTPQLKQNADFSGFSDSEGNFIDERIFDKLNRELYLSCGVMEKFLDGKSFYTVNIIHFPLDETVPANTGNFGIVRNHHYVFNITSVSGFGNGVPNEEAVIRHLPGRSGSDSFTLGVTVNVIPWIKVSQPPQF